MTGALVSYFHARLANYALPHLRFLPPNFTVQHNTLRFLLSFIPCFLCFSFPFTVRLVFLSVGDWDFGLFNLRFFSGLSLKSANVTRLNPLVLELLLNCLAGHDGVGTQMHLWIPQSVIWVPCFYVQSLSPPAHLQHSISASQFVRRHVTGYLKLCTSHSTLAKVLVVQLQIPFLFSMFTQRTTMSLFIL